LTAISHLQQRKIIERMFCRFKGWRRVAMRAGGSVSLTDPARLRDSEKNPY